MPKLDAYEQEILGAFEKGSLKSVATKAEIEKLKAAARATAVKDRRVNIRLSSIDLSDIQVKALEEGIPYQTLIASVLHKYVNGRLTFLGSKERSVDASSSAAITPPCWQRRAVTPTCGPCSSRPASGLWMKSGCSAYGAGVGSY